MHDAEPPGPLPPTSAFPPFAALRAFDAVARLGGVRRAGEALDIHHSAVSRHISSLEDWTGAKLMTRSGRGATLTEEGWRYHARIATALNALAEATQSFVKNRQRSRLVVWSRPGIAMEWLVPRLDDLRRAHPGLELELRPTHIAPDFRRTDVDLFLQYVSSYEQPPEPTEDVLSCEFSRSDIIPIASPAYIAGAPKVCSASDFLDHQIIEDGEADAWRVWLSSCQVDCQGQLSGSRYWNPQLALDAARRGQGILLSTRFLAQADLEAGTLVEVVGTDGPFSTGVTGSYLLVGRRAEWDAGSSVMFRRWILSAVASPGREA